MQQTNLACVFRGWGRAGSLVSKGFEFGLPIHRHVWDCLIDEFMPSGANRMECLPIARPTLKSAPFTNESCCARHHVEETGHRAPAECRILVKGLFESELDFLTYRSARTGSGFLKCFSTLSGDPKPKCMPLSRTFWKGGTTPPPYCVTALSRFRHSPWLHLDISLSIY